MTRRTVIVFARAPEPGACKTRLQPALGAQGCAALQRMFIEHALREALSAGASCVELCCAPDTTHPFFADMASTYDIELSAQRGHDLGERMQVALEHALDKGGPALLIGTDCPLQNAARIRSALAALEPDTSGHGAQVSLRPARDGGYVAVGLSRYAPAVFAGIPWGTNVVMQRTREAMKLARLRWRELAALPDVDVPADIAALPALWSARIACLRSAD